MAIFTLSVLIDYSHVLFFIHKTFIATKSQD